ncbi:hypothetical protein BJ742DRAFT_535729 [Cladochytrium replicatum]|nr:hypothetical protein BJ742DRAFT_535729 [Cladochytrium replicatum]
MGDGNVLWANAEGTSSPCSSHNRYAHCCFAIVQWDRPSPNLSMHADASPDGAQSSHARDHDPIDWGCDADDEENMDVTDAKEKDHGHDDDDIVDDGARKQQLESGSKMALENWKSTGNKNVPLGTHPPHEPKNSTRFEIVAIGGWSEADEPILTVDAFDPETESWRCVDILEFKIPWSNYSCSDFLTVEHKGTVFCFVALQYEPYLDAEGEIRVMRYMVWKYEVQSKSLSKLSDVHSNEAIENTPMWEYDGTMVHVSGNKSSRNGALYFIGGLGKDDQPCDQFLRFDLVTCQWEAGCPKDTAPSFSSKSFCMCLEDHNGGAKLVCFGGVTNLQNDLDTNKEEIRTIALFDIGTAIWSYHDTHGPISGGFAPQSATFLGNRIVVLGGFPDSEKAVVRDSAVEMDVDEAITSRDNTRTSENGVFVLDLSEWTWKHAKAVDMNVLSFELSPACTVFGNYLFVNGGTLQCGASPAYNTKSHPQSWWLELGPPPPPQSFHVSEVGLNHVALTWSDPFHWLPNRAYRIHAMRLDNGISRQTRVWGTVGMRRRNRNGILVTARVTKLRCTITGLSGKQMTVSEGIQPGGVYAFKLETVNSAGGSFVGVSGVVSRMDKVDDYAYQSELRVHKADRFDAQVAETIVIGGSTQLFDDNGVGVVVVHCSSQLGGV